MKAKPRLPWLLYLACLTFVVCPIGADEPTGGLVQVLLTPSELGMGAIRRVRLLLDPQVNPSVYYPSKDDLPGAPDRPVDPVDAAAPFKRDLVRLGAEAATYLAYYLDGEWSYLKILRFSTPEKAHEFWLGRRREGKSRLVGVPLAGNVLFTEAGQQLRPGQKARMDTVECAAGNYVVRLAPAQLHPRDQGLNLLVKQIEKIMGIGEPASAAIQSQPGASQSNRSPTAAVSGR